MSEKRFELVSVCGDFGIIDAITDEVWFFETYESVVKVVDLLNELNDENKELKKENKKLIEDWEFSFRTEMAHHRFAEKELQEKIREKQATITELEKRLEHYAKVKAMNGDGKNE